MQSAADAIDNALLEDRIPNLINSVFLEVLVREAYSIWVSFSQCRQKNDWLRPKGGQANWKSRVDFEMIQRLNPRAGEAKADLVKGAEQEIRIEMQRDALISKARNDWASRATDPINT